VKRHTPSRTLSASCAVAQAQGLRGGAAFQHLQVAVVALQRDVGLQPLAGAHVHARGHAQVAGPAQPRARAQQEGQYRHRRDLRAQLQVRVAGMGAVAHLVPAQRHAAGQRGAAGGGLHRRHGPVLGEAHLAAELARVEPGGVGRGAALGAAVPHAHRQPVEAAAPGAPTCARAVPAPAALQPRLRAGGRLQPEAALQPRRRLQRRGRVQ
jgi:hypothetical protein